MARKPKDLTGQRFGRLIAIKRLEKGPDGSFVWLCQCDCGRTKEVSIHRLTDGKTNSCGCKMNELYSKMRSGELNYKRNHGMSNTRLYKIWKEMRRRVHNRNRENYSRYGQRGIAVCDEWDNDFKSFYEWSMKNGYKDNLEIDRVDNNGNYSPENCRWVTKVVNANNRSTTRFITYEGQTKSAAEWAKEMNIPYTKLIYRLNANWDLVKAFSL